MPKTGAVKAGLILDTRVACRWCAIFSPRIRIARLRNHSNRGSGAPDARVGRSAASAVSFFRARRRFAIHVPVVNHEIERLDFRIWRIAAMHGPTLIADDDVLDDAPDEVIEDRDADERQVCPRHEHRAQRDERDAGGAVEVFLKIQFRVSARRAVIDDRVSRRRSDARPCPAVVAGIRAPLTGKAALTSGAEKVDACQTIWRAPGTDYPPDRRGSLRRL
jgi:hypothetical protein